MHGSYWLRFCGDDLATEPPAALAARLLAIRKLALPKHRLASCSPSSRGNRAAQGFASEEGLPRSPTGSLGGRRKSGTPAYTTLHIRNYLLICEARVSIQQRLFGIAHRLVSGLLVRLIGKRGRTRGTRPSLGSYVRARPPGLGCLSVVCRRPRQLHATPNPPSARKVVCRPRLRIPLLRLRPGHSDFPTPTRLSRSGQERTSGTCCEVLVAHL
jgi:hypothetical protein